ncbi:Ig-like domain-containing protein [Veronia nyctiphanis]|uniref:Ig-like domain-containing protein n=1 Tax=Veronia nyctiphanis TaxID=1278244 RepID=UPI00100C27F0|nr:Ig-like domain-containing protein [Veronia nyctiphanis]
MEYIKHKRYRWLLLITVFLSGCFTVDKKEVDIEKEDGGQAVIDVVLTDRPSNRVVLDIVSDLPDEVTVSRAQLTFTSSNWNTPQTVTLTAIDDDTVDNDTAKIKVSVNRRLSDFSFGFAQDRLVNVTVVNDDLADVRLSKTAMTIPENAGAGEFTAVLTAQPKSDVIVDVESNDVDEATVTPSQITFSPSNWNTPQALSVFGIDDDKTTTDTATVSVSVNPLSDGGFVEIPVKSVLVTLENDDDGEQPKAIKVDPAQPPEQLVVTLPGRNDYFKLHKTSQRGPDFEVVRVRSDGTKEALDAGEVRTYTGYSPTAPEILMAATLLHNGDLRYQLFRGVNDDIIGNPSSAAREDDYDASRPTNVTFWDRMPAPPITILQPMGTLTDPAPSPYKLADLSLILDASRWTNLGFQKDRSIIEKTETSINFTDALYLRDMSWRHPIDKVLIYETFPASGTNEWTKTKTRVDSLFPGNISDHYATIGQVGGGLAFVCNTHSISAVYNSFDAGYAEFWHVFRHEIGHNHGSGHYTGGAPEGATIMSGNSIPLSKISGPESDVMKGCASWKFKDAYRDGQAPSHPVPPYAKFDKVLIKGSEREIVLDVLSNDIDANNDKIGILDFVTSTRNGTIRFEPADSASGRDKLVYTVDSVLAIGEKDRFTYRIIDANGQISTGQIEIQRYPESITLSTNADLNNIASNAEEVAKLYDYYREVKFVTSNGNWASNIRLPSGDRLEGRDFLLTVNSAYAVNLHVNGEVKTYFRGQTISGTYGNGAWKLFEIAF